MGKGKSGGMLGVGGTRHKLSRGALRGGTGGAKDERALADAEAKRRELLRKFQERNQKE
ncbi:DUF6243 family protein [Streptomyces noursei]|uniref:DUF6243 family protein n=1 Tax=Streptomyces noursei TaxID=1971 RepID=UPI00081C603D|nr:hypothetical protein SNOUR_10215 [Streptomyces noursei ATCC 11455]MCZ0992662.1 DUF6243 family protein [Streptomyces noursei]